MHAGWQRVVGQPPEPQHEARAALDHDVPVVAEMRREDARVAPETLQRVVELQGTRSAAPDQRRDRVLAEVSDLREIEVELSLLLERPVLAGVALADRSREHVL